MKRKCVCCGGNNLLNGVTIADRTENGSIDANVRVDSNPDALIFKGTEKATIHCELCDDCGHLQLFVPRRAMLRAAIRKRDGLEACKVPIIKERGEDGELRAYTTCSNCEAEHRLADCPKCGHSADVY